jgi:uncharacterized protein
MDDLARKPTSPLSALAEQAAPALLELIEGSTAILIASADGFDLAHAGDLGTDPARLAAILSSFAAIGEAASRETRIGTPRYLAIECAEGRIVARCVQARGQSVVVVALTDQSVLLGWVWNRLGEAEKLLNRE